MNNTNDILTASGIVKTFPGAVALDKVNFSLRRGEVHALLGENGAGKSTLIKCMTGAYRRDAGTLDTRRHRDRSARHARRSEAGHWHRIPGSQSARKSERRRKSLSWPPTAPLRSCPHGRDEPKRATALLAQYGIGHQCVCSAGQLSRSPIQQVVAIARAVDLSGKILILDEPTASLDAQEVEMLFRIVR